MKRFSYLGIAAVALVASATLATAQVVNKLEVQKLVAANTADASATLAAHFNALADQYAATAAQHKAMGNAYRASANRSVVTSGAAHCERLAQLAADEAVAAREMAKYHEQLAGGTTATLPKDAGAFHGGKGAPDPTADQLHHLAMVAKGPADHHALEEYFLTVAKKNTEDADNHIAMAKWYRAGVRKNLADPAAHCDRIARLAREAAKEATAAATLHRQLANIG